MPAIKVQTIAITGATGFVGKHLLDRLLQREDVALYALAHNAPDATLRQDKRLNWIRGDLARAATPDRLLVPAGILVNLAFPADWPHETHLAATARVAQAGAERGMRRVIHCSSAVVVGRTSERQVSETTHASPQTGYEKVKLAIEEVWHKHAIGAFELGIARPTAVFGPHGKNLLKLAHALTAGSRTVNYVRSSLFAHRRMNLLCVRDFVAALELLIDYEMPLHGETFIVSDDGAPANNYRDVERALMLGMGVRDYAVAPLPVPHSALAGLLRLMGPAKADPFRTYDSSLLTRAGWRKPCGLEQGLREFAAWYAATCVYQGAKAL